MEEMKKTLSPTMSLNKKRGMVAQAGKQAADAKRAALHAKRAAEQEEEEEEEKDTERMRGLLKGPLKHKKGQLINEGQVRGRAIDTSVIMFKSSCVGLIMQFVLSA